MDAKTETEHTAHVRAHLEARPGGFVATCCPAHRRTRRGLTYECGSPWHAAHGTDVVRPAPAKL